MEYIGEKELNHKLDDFVHKVPVPLCTGNFVTVTKCPDPDVIRWQSYGLFLILPKN